MQKVSAFLAADKPECDAIPLSGVDRFARQKQLANRWDKAGAPAKTDKPSRTKTASPLALVQKRFDMFVRDRPRRGDDLLPDVAATSLTKVREIAVQKPKVERAHKDVSQHLDVRRVDRRIYACSDLSALSSAGRPNLPSPTKTRRRMRLRAEMTEAYSTSSTTTVRPDRRWASEASMNGSRSPSSTSDGVPETWPVRRSLTI